MDRNEEILLKVKNYVNSLSMIAPGDRLLLGVSGGSDSLCLLKILLDIYGSTIELFVVHINHMLRREANEEADYVKEICDRFNVPCRIENIDVQAYALQNGLGTEEAGRKMRYAAFEKWGNERWGQESYKIAVAHNLQDNAETVLLNLFRGSGLDGMCGIEPVRGNIIRPIRCLTKNETREYLENLGIKYCIDASNDTDAYARNRVRRHLIAYAREEINSSAVENVAAMSETMSDLKAYIAGETEKNLKLYIIEEGSSLVILSSLVEDLHHYMAMNVLYRAFISLSGQKKDVERKHIEALLKLFNKQNGKMLDLPYKIQAVRVYEGVRLFAKSNQKEPLAKSLALSLGPNQSIRVGSMAITTRLLEYKKNINIPQDKYTKWFDYDKITNALVLRTRQDGDMISVGDKASQTLKKYFINEKVSEEKRQEMLLVADGKNIVWAVGMRIGSFYKISDNTRNILEIKILCEDDNCGNVCSTH